LNGGTITEKLEKAEDFTGQVLAINVMMKNISSFKTGHHHTQGDAAKAQGSKRK
jgi:hypothetical protein